MAEVISLGVYTPSALTYLVAESLLPRDPQPGTYTWNCYSNDSGREGEEVLFTTRCVVYSRDGHIHRVFKYTEDDGEVEFAELTNFPASSAFVHGSVETATPAVKRGQLKKNANQLETGTFGRSGRTSRKSLPNPSDGGNERSPLSTSDPGDGRALAIFVGKQCHVHFLRGTTHIVSVPFDVAHVFPAQSGLIVQRHTKARPQSSGNVPGAPPNSFYSSQPQPSPFPKSPLGQNRSAFNFSLDGSPASRRFSTTVGFGGDPDDEDMPRFLALSDPLSDFQAVASATVAPLPRHLRAEASDLMIEYDDFDASENLLYVSNRDEMAALSSAENVAPLLIIVTMNEELGQISIWQGWYLHAKSLSFLTTVRQAVKTARAHRRNSINTNVPIERGVTPSVRFHDKGRESFAANAQLPKSRNGQKQRKSNVAHRTEEEEAAVMASHMDPDFREADRFAKGPHRAGSLLSRGDLTSFDTMRGPGGQISNNTGPAKRGPSLRMSQDRRSFGTSIYRKSRGSVQGSTFSKSIGPGDEDSMDLEDDSFLQAESDTEMARALQLILATNELASLDSALVQSNDTARPSMVVRKVHVMPIPDHPAGLAHNSRSKRRFKIRTMISLEDATDSTCPMTMYIHDKAEAKSTVLKFLIRSPSSLPGAPANADTKQMWIPLFQSQEEKSGIRDIAKVASNSQKALISSIGGGLLRVSPGAGYSWDIRLPSKSRLFDTADIRLDLEQTSRDVGRSRTVALSDKEFDFLEGPCSSQICAVGRHGSTFRLHISLRPESDLVNTALAIMRTVLSGQAQQSVMFLWASACGFLRNESSSIPDAQLEMEALVMTMFAFAAGSMNHTNTRRPLHSHGHKDNGTAQLIPFEAITSSRPISNAWERLAEQQPANDESQSRASKSRISIHGFPAQHIAMSDMEAKARALLHQVSSGELSWLMDPRKAATRAVSCLQIMLAIQLLREEIKLTTSQDDHVARTSQLLAASLAQMGHYLGLTSWDWRGASGLAHDFGFRDWGFSVTAIPEAAIALQYQSLMPFTIDEWLDGALSLNKLDPTLTLDDIFALDNQAGRKLVGNKALILLPNITRLQSFFRRLGTNDLRSTDVVEAMEQYGIGRSAVERISASISNHLQEQIGRCQEQPPSTWSPSLLQLVDRDDLSWTMQRHGSQAASAYPSQGHASTDIQSITSSAERMAHSNRSHAADRNAVVALLFSDDRRLIDAHALMNPSAMQIAECPPRPEWSEVEHLDQQKRLMQWVMTRTTSLPPGNGMFHFESQKPLLSEKFHVPGFSMQCQMKPMDNTISADRTGFTEEKLSWAFFHAGTAAGLNISRTATGIDTSWIVFNKPQELTNRHAGFLLAIGLSGHLRNMAKWLAFKYLTPKHSMTSIGLLLGLSASYMGTMDTLITRMLSVHITRVLPPGAAELNVSPLTQTAGLLGIGMLYYNTQHRRMSEIMLSELEHRDIEEAGSAADALRDESYRLAAGFALGLMNLGKGNTLQGLQGMGLLERLLSIAVGPRPVDLVHVIDKATAGSIVAITFVYMKTNDASIARKIDVPDASSQLDHIRPDMLLLRALAKNLIMWDSIVDERGWIRSQVPAYASYFYSPKSSTLSPALALRSADVPIYNILTGHAWSLSIKYAGSGSTAARDEILSYLDAFWTCAQQSASFYDARLTRTTITRCIDVLALSAATVMAGTGDLITFRYLRRLHGRTNSETTYGSHMAAHLAIGALFLGGGSYTFSNSTLAVAGLIMAFYPLFPSEVLDNAVHLQAFRHLWVLAAEARCVVCMDVDSGRPVSMQLRLNLRNGESKSVQAPCLLPDLDTIASVETQDIGYWRTKLDFVNNREHLKRFRETQTIHVRKAPATEVSPLVFSQTLMGLNEQLNITESSGMWKWLVDFNPTLQQCTDPTELDLILPSSERSAVHLDERSTVVDERLALWAGAHSSNVDQLSNLRLLLAWSEKKRSEGDGRLKWLGNDFVERLESVLEMRMVDMYGEQIVE